MSDYRLSEEEVAAIVKKRDELQALVEPFGLRLIGFDPGVLVDFEGHGFELDGWLWVWLKPLLEELLVARSTAIELNKILGGETTKEEGLPRG